jgi:hypothetical protein
MDERKFRVVARASNPWFEDDLEQLTEYLSDSGTEVSPIEDDIMFFYEAGGNVDAIQHTQSLLRELDDAGVETDELMITTERID